MDNPAVSLVAILCVLFLVLGLGCLMDFPDWKKRTEYSPLKIKQVKRIIIIAILLVIGFLVSLTGCKKVEPKPCKEMQDSIQKMYRKNLKH